MKETIAAIGFFDGMHLGHLSLLEKLKNEAAARKLSPLVFTFNNHPKSVIDPEYIPACITDTQTRKKFFKELGVDAIFLDFNPQLREISVADWFKIMHSQYNVKMLMMGYDTNFGSDGKNFSQEEYKKTGHKFGIEIINAPLIDGISSSKVRKAISKGKIEEATDMLGRHFSITGRVETGNRIGRQIGFPTANIIPASGMLLPPDGVYACIVDLPNGERKEAMVNIGTRPTVVKDSRRMIEVNIFDWNGNIYGNEIRVNFIHRLRDETRFDSLSELQQQLIRDRELTREALSCACDTQKSLQ